MNESVLLKTNIFLLIAAIFSVSGYAQVQNAPDQKLEESFITGSDTSVFAIIGDPLSTVSPSLKAIDLPNEQRLVTNSKGLLGEDQRLRRITRFPLSTGPGADIRFTTGSRQINDFFAKAGYDAGDRGGTLRLTHWSGEEHTMTNFAPSAQDVEFMGYDRFPLGDIRVDAGYTRQRERVQDHGSFRPDDRALTRFRGDVSLETGLPLGWEFTGRTGFVTGTYRDLTVAGENRELFLNVDGQGVRTLRGVEYRISGHMDRYTFRESTGSSMTAGAAGSISVGNLAGFTAGVSAAVYRMPGGSAKLKIFPYAGANFITRLLTFHAEYKPGLATHTFGDLYDTNGLAVFTIPVLYETISSDLRAEIGFNPGFGLRIGAGSSYRKSDHAPVFTRAVAGKKVYYEILKDAEVSRRALFLTASWIPSEQLTLSGEIRSNDASWNFSGNVPYIPKDEVSAVGTYTFLRVWTAQASAHYWGRHSVERNSSDTEDPFLVVNLSFERSIVQNVVSLVAELRNLTGADGSWWSGEYRIPGFGFYLGVKTHY